MNGGLEINVLFDDGSKRKTTIAPSAFNLVKRFAGTMPSFFEGTGMNLLDADFSSIVAVTRADHDKLHQIPSAYRKADFRLGQMDMQASVCDMLRNIANDAADQVRAGLVLAADLVETMEVPNADT